MDMRMDLTPEQQLTVAVVQAQADITLLQEGQKELREFILGNGDPKKGLLWLCTNQGELLTSMGQLIAAQVTALSDHKKDGSHIVVQPSMFTRLQYEAARQVIVSAVIIVLVIIAWVVVSFVRAGGKSL